MKTNKAVVVVLAAAILASGGSIAGSVVTATPAQAATVIAPKIPNAPTGVKIVPKSGWFQPTMNIVWTAPTGGYGTTTTGYAVTLKQAGKADRVFTSKTASVSVSGFTENTAYTVQVKANVTSTTGVKGVTAPVITSIRTGYSNYAPTSVKVSAPMVNISEATYNSVTALMKTPGFTVGKVTGYTVKVKQGTTVINSQVIPTIAGNDTGSFPVIYKTAGLKSNTTYTLEVSTNAVSYVGNNPAHVFTSVNFITAKSSIVTVAKPVVSVSNVASKTAKVTWKKPAVTGEIRTYLLFVTEKGTTQSMRLGEYSPASTSDQLPSILKPNTTYTVSVIAIAASQDGKNTAQAVTHVDFTTAR